MNHKFFVLFVFYSAMSCLVSMLLLFLRYMHCGVHANSNNSPQQQSPPLLPECQSFLGIHDDGDHNHSNNMSVTALGIVSFIFFLFTTAMSCEQLEAIQTGKGKIARMKTDRSSTMRTAGGRNASEQPQDEYERVTEEFNEMFGGNSPHVAWHWWLPTTVHFPLGMKPMVLGYELETNALNTVYRQNENDDDEEGENQQLLRANDHLQDEEMGIKINQQQPVAPTTIFSREASAVSIDSLLNSGKSSTVKNRRNNGSGGRESVSPVNNDDEKKGGSGDEVDGISLVERSSSSVTSSPKTRMT
jgi:hypothetical protein